MSDTVLIQVKNPVTGEIVGSVPNHAPEQVRAAVYRARAAQPAWEERGAPGRARLLRLWGEELWQRRAEMIRVIRQETGKNETGALLEIIVLDNVINYYADRALRPQRRRTLFPLLQYARVYYHPYGVAGFITPWNYPYLNALMDAVAALAAGNAVVIKPSEITPFTALRAVDLAYRAGLPCDALQVVTGDGATGAALVDYVDTISVTGSTATGRKVAQRAAARLIPYSLELGGKDPLIVLDDVDLDIVATAILQGALENAGQVCVGIERVYALDSIYDRLIERLVYHAQHMVIGSGGGLGVHMGSLTNEREVKRCEAQIADAVAKGARLVYGGQRRPDLGPLFLEPALLADVDHTMDIMCEETFGPLIPVMRVSSAEEAIQLSNDCSYGLSSAIFTRNLKRGEQLATRLHAGDTSINRTQFVIGTPTLPMGGRKESGVGRRGGPEGLMRFVTPQAVLVDRMWFSRPTLTLLDPFLYRVLLIMHVLRRYLPFLRP
jgi:acyl-CoA reductase-like NAD-dependent aldehyde dehydrogenase